MKKITDRKASVAAIIMWLGLIWLHTFIRMTNYSYSKGTMEYLWTVLYIIGMTFLWFWCLLDDSTGLLDDIFEPSRSINRSMILVAVLAGLMLTAVAVEFWSYDFTILGEREIDLWVWSIDKKDIYDIVVMVVFPLMTSLVFRGMALDRFRTRSVISGSIQIAVLTIMNFLIFMVLHNVWVVEMAAINVLTIAGAIRKYAWPVVRKKWNAAGFSGLYALLWGFLLSRFYYSGESAVQYLYGGDYSERVANIRVLVQQAGFVGTSDALRANSTVYEYLADHSDYIHSILYYGGWLPTIIFLAFLIMFLVLTWKMVGRRNRVEHRHQLIFDAAFWTIALRIIIGIPYSFGLLPIPIGLPFGGDRSIIFDTIAFGLLLICAFENRRIDETKALVLVQAADVLGRTSDAPDRMSSVSVTDAFTEEEYVEQDDWLLDEDDEVVVKSADVSISCRAHWYEYKGRKFIALKVDDENKLLVLEFLDTDKSWAEVKDLDFCEALLEKYRSDNKPDCMETLEVDEDGTEEEADESEESDDN